MSSPKSPARLTFAESLEQSLARLGDRPRTAAFGGTLASLLGVALVPGCDPAPPAGTGTAGTDVATRSQEVLADGQRDWAQNMGSRDRSMVRYYHEYWRTYTDCGSRFGCSSITMFVKVAVKPVTGADLSYKKVGVAYREVGSPNPTTATGYYFATHPDGMEEWHVPIKSFSHLGAFTFNAWYEDGKYGRYYDDNNGELYALAWTDPNADFVTVRPDFASSTAKVTDTGIEGRLSLVIEDLDYDKDLSLEWTTDNWATTHTFGMGNAGDSNKVRWESNISRDFDRWSVDLSIPGSFTTFQFRIVYKHGVVGGADTDTFVGGGATGWRIDKS